MMERGNGDLAPGIAAAPVVVAARRLMRKGRPWFARGVSYGPFPGDTPPFLPSGEILARDLDALRACGFDCLRTYHPPPREFLDACARRGLLVWAGFPWAWQSDFLANGAVLDDACAAFGREVRALAGHPALAGWAVANEIDAGMVRWLGTDRVRKALENLVRVGRDADPESLFFYASYPPTEWLHPDNTDFVALNVYLEEEESLRRYLRHAHHLAGDRPLLLTECGLDRLSHGAQAQADWLDTAYRVAEQEGMAGLIWFTWSDAWRHAVEGCVHGWKFGLVDEKAQLHPAADTARKVLPRLRAVPSPPEPPPLVSVIVCTRNGGQRLLDCLQALELLDYPRWEAVLVDDGSEDGTAGRARVDFPWVHVLSLPPSGLSCARNAGGRYARGDVFAFIDDDCLVEAGWLRSLVAGMCGENWDAAGGPNIPPPSPSKRQSVLNRLPGTAFHVLLDDRRAEHLPGCNLAVTRHAFHEIGGFDPIFHTAGDDVDFCWRLLAAGKRVGYLPGAALWHHRRASVFGYLRQQFGYGQAEALLARRWSGKMREGSARWSGVVYGPPGAVGAIYRSSFGEADFPVVYPDADRPRPPEGVGRFWAKGFAFLCHLQPWARWLGRRGRGERPPLLRSVKEVQPPSNTHREMSWWHDGSAERVPVVRALALVLAERGAAVREDDGWSDWDLDVRLPGGGRCQLLTMTEYREDGTCLTRARLGGEAPACEMVEEALARVVNERGGNADF